MMTGNYWDSLSSLFSNMVKSEGFKSVMGAVLPTAVGAGVATLGSVLSPGTPERVYGADVRTGTGQAAEGIRLGAAQGVGKQYQDALQGKLDPEEERQIAKRERASSAAAGSLETGGHVVRERNAMRAAVNDNRKTLASQVGALTGGYQALSPQRMGARPSNFATFMSALAPAAADATKKGWESWSSIGSDDSKPKFQEFKGWGDYL